MSAAAVIGLGHMGSRVAQRLLDAGHEVRTWDRRDQPLRAVTEIAADVDVVFTVLANDEAVREVVLGTGLLESLRDGAVFVDLSTTSPELVEDLAKAPRAGDADILDVEMSGSTPTLDAGELVLLVGGDEAVLERVRPFLDPLSKSIYLMGPLGAGAKMKLAVNIMLGVGMEALAEAIVFAEGAGLDRATVLETFGHLAVVAPAHHGKLEHAAKNDYPVEFALRLMAKDFGLVLAHAEEHGIDLPATKASAEVSERALAVSNEDEDFAIVIRQLEQEAGVRPRR
ncbi:MAG TPA: NAD(P)-dependent oxidoreductase [Gaiellaceae bacterium]|nr:NAD(P)-dependent oxidoreductase [Gaiellaceae bacterium]